MLDDFLIRSLLAGTLMVLVAAPMGCLMLWQRLSFLADTLAHASVLGVAIALLMSMHPMIGVLLVVLLVVLIVQQGAARQPLRMSESTLAIIAHAGLAAGILLLGISGYANFSLEAILFGDLLATSPADLGFIFMTVILLLGLLLRYWRAFVALSVSPEIAQAEGVAVERVKMMLYLMIALLIAVMMKVMGVLLIGAMLVIPTNAARVFSRSPEQMLVFSLLFGLLSLFSGLSTSWIMDLQTGPAIVVLSTLWLLLALIGGKLKKRLT